MDNPAEDKENQHITRQKKSESRRSSILKSNRLSDLDVNAKVETQVSRRVSRRVSFAETYVVKEFLCDSPQRWNLEPNSPEAESDTVASEATNAAEDPTVPNITGFDKLLTGTIQSQDRNGMDESVFGAENNQEQELDALHLLNLSLPEFNSDGKDVFISCSKVAFPNEEREIEEKIDSRSFLSQFSTTSHMTSSILGQSCSDGLQVSKDSGSHSNMATKSFLEKMKEPEFEEKINSRTSLPQFSTTRHMPSSFLGQTDSDGLRASTISDSSNSEVDSRSFLEKLKGSVSKVTTLGTQSSMKLPSSEDDIKAAHSVQISVKTSDMFDGRSNLPKSFIAAPIDTRMTKPTEPIIQDCDPVNIDSSMHTTCQNLPDVADSDLTELFDDDTMDITCPSIADMQNKSTIMNNSADSAVHISKTSVAGHSKVDETSHQVSHQTSKQTGLPKDPVANSNSSFYANFTRTLEKVDRANTSKDRICQTIPHLKNESNVAGNGRQLSHDNNTSVMDMTSLKGTDHTRIFRSSDHAAIMEMTCQNLPSVNTESVSVEKGHTMIFGKGKDAAAMELTCEVVSSNCKQTEILENSMAVTVNEKTIPIAQGVIVKSVIPETGHTIVFGKDNNGSMMEMTGEIVPDQGQTTIGVHTNHTRIFGMSENTAAMELTCSVPSDLTTASTGHTIVFGKQNEAAAMEMTCEIKDKSTIADKNSTRIFGTAENTAAMEMTCEIKDKSTIADKNSTRIFGTAENTAAMEMTCEIKDKSTIADKNSTRIFGTAENTAAMEMTCEIKDKSTIADKNSTRIFGTAENTAAMEMTCEIKDKSTIADKNSTRIFGTAENTAAMEMTCEIKDKSTIADKNSTRIFGTTENTAAMEMTCEIKDKSTIADKNSTRIFGTTENTAAMEMTCEIKDKSTIADKNSTRIFGTTENTAAMEMTCEIKDKSTIADKNSTRIFGTTENTAAMEMTCEIKDKSTIADKNSTRIFGNSENTAAMEMTCEIKDKSTIADKYSTRIFSTTENSAMEVGPNIKNKTVETNCTRIFGNSENTVVMELTCPVTPNLNAESTVGQRVCTVVTEKGNDTAVMELTCATPSDVENKSTVEGTHTRIFEHSENTAFMELTCHDLKENWSLANEKRKSINDKNNTAVQNENMNCSAIKHTSEDSNVMTTAWEKISLLKTKRDDTRTFETAENMPFHGNPGIKGIKSDDGNHTKIFGVDNSSAITKLTSSKISMKQDILENVSKGHTQEFGNNEVASELEIKRGIRSDIKPGSSAFNQGCTRVFANNDSIAAMEMTCQTLSELKGTSFNTCTNKSRQHDSTVTGAAMEMTCQTLSDLKDTSVNSRTDNNRQPDSTLTGTAMEMTCQLMHLKDTSVNSRTDNNRQPDSTLTGTAMEMTCQMMHLKDTSVNKAFGTSEHAECTTLSQVAGTGQIPVTNQAEESAFGRHSFNNTPRSVPDPIALSNTLKHKLYAFDMVLAGARAKNMKLVNRSSARQQDSPENINEAISVTNGCHDLNTTIKMYKMSEHATAAEELENTKHASNSMMTSDVFDTDRTQSGERKHSGYTIQLKSDPFTNKLDDALKANFDEASKMKSDKTPKMSAYAQKVKSNIAQKALLDDAAKTNCENLCSKDITLSDMTLRLKQKVDRTLTQLTFSDLNTVGKCSATSQGNAAQRAHLDLAAVETMGRVPSKEIASCITEQNLSPDLAIPSDVLISNDLVQSINSTSSEETTSVFESRMLMNRSQMSVNQNQRSMNEHQSSMNQSQLSLIHNQSSMNQSQLYRTVSSCPIHDKFCKKMDISHKDWLKIRTSHFMQELEADSLQDVLKIQTLKVCKYEIVDTVLRGLTQENEKLETEIENIKIAMDEAEPRIFKFIEGADHTELEELKEKVNACKYICWKKAKSMWKSKQIHRNLDYITSMQNQRSVLHKAMDDIITQIESVQNVITQLQEISTDLDDEVENPEAKKHVEKVDQAKHHLLIEKEIELKRCLKETEDVLRKEKLAGEEVRKLDTKDSMLIDDLIESRDLRKAELDEASKMLGWKLKMLKSIHQWELKEQSSSHCVFLFFYGALELTILFEPGQLDSVSCISLVSCLSDESSALVQLVVRLIVESTDTTKLRKRYSTKANVPQLLHDISHTVGQVHSATDEIDRVSLCNTIDIKEKNITVSVLTVAKVRKLSLSFTLTSSGYPHHLSEYDIIVHMGSIMADEMRQHLSTVAPGCNYLLRLVNEMKRVIQL